MNRAEQIAENASRLPGDLGDACLKVVNHILSTKQPLNEITLRRLAEIAEIESRETLLSVAAILTSRFRVLSWHFVYFDDEGNPHYLTDEEAAHFVRTGDFIDPDRGLVQDAASKVFPYLSADKPYLLSEVP